MKEIPMEEYGERYIADGGTKEYDEAAYDEEIEEVGDEHLQELQDGLGCTEIWEKLSEQREE